MIAATAFFLMSVPWLLLDADTPSIIRTLACGALAVAVYHRHNWARWLLLVVVVLAVLFVLYLLLTTPMPGPLTVIFMAACLLYAGVLALLFVPSWGGKYFQSESADSVRGPML